MIAVPLIVVWVSSQVIYFKLPMLSALVLSLVLSFVCSTVASRIWERRSKAAEISFSELMIWSWYRLQKAERQLEQGIRDAETTGTREEQREVLHGLALALETKDPYTRGHSRRVERYALKTGVALGLPIAEVDVLRMSASLHDVGKIRVPNSVLHKPGPLTDEERILIEEHAALGAEMVSSIGDEQIVQAVRHHHERWDGYGYPDGLAGSAIPLFARVIAVADSYDAIRSSRSYRRGASRDEAVGVLKDGSGHQWDADVVDAFLETLPARGRAVAWFTSLATGPGAVWRYIQQFFQRFGSAAAAPAIGAAAGAVILWSSSLLSPTAPAFASPWEGILQQTPPEGSASSDPRDVSGGSDRQQATEQARAERQRLAAQERADRRRAAQRRERSAAGSTTGNNQSSPSSTASGGNEPAASKPVLSKTAASKPAASKPATSEPSTSDTGGSDPAVSGDPNDEGRDCKAARPDSKGSRLHCD